MNASALTKTLVVCRPSAPAGVLSETFQKLFRLKAAATTELFLVRHAEADYRAAFVNRTGEDPPLSENGRWQARRLAPRLQNMAVDRVYTATSQRCLETASLIANASDQAIVEAPHLREVSFQMPISEEPFREPQRLAEEMAIRFIHSPRWDALRGCEPTRQFRHRVIQSIEAIVAAHPGKRLVIVADETVINAYVTMVLTIERDMFFLPEHASISFLRVLNELYAVQNLNDIAHLLPPN